MTPAPVKIYKEIMLNVEDISLMWAKEKHLNSYVQVFWQGREDLNVQLFSFVRIVTNSLSQVFCFDGSWRSVSHTLLSRLL
jgi:hypothetical protein